jgi:hypothetical protein
MIVTSHRRIVQESISPDDAQDALQAATLTVLADTGHRNREHAVV